MRAASGAEPVREALEAWLEILFYGFLLLPILASSLLLSAVSDNKLLATEAGISCGFFGGLAFISPVLVLLFFGGLLMNLKPLSPGLRAGVPAIICFFAAVPIYAIRIAWISVRVSKKRLGRLPLGRQHHDPVSFGGVGSHPVGAAERG
jgi:hypothetical protein